MLPIPPLSNFCSAEGERERGREEEQNEFVCSSRLRDATRMVRLLLAVVHVRSPIANMARKHDRHVSDGTLSASPSLRGAAVNALLYYNTINTATIFVVS